MKKAIWISLFILGALTLNKAHAMNNLDNYQAWRVTETATADGYVFLSSGCPCVIWDLTVASGAANPGQDVFQFYGSTSATNLTWNKSVSTSTPFDIDTAGTNYAIGDVITSTAVYYSKTGPAAIRLRYDNFYVQPKGQERKGRK